MVAAAYLPAELVKNPAEKLALMKLADSADDDTRLSTPTMRRMVAWVGVGEKRCSTLITNLVAKGLVERVGEAREGRAQVYRVFPGGIPLPPDRDELDDRLRALRQRPKNPRLARPADRPRRRPDAPARTSGDVERRNQRPTEAPAAPAEGSPGATQEQEVRVSPGEPAGFPQGNRQGFPGETPSFPVFLTSPPYLDPPTPAAGAAREPDAAGQRESSPVPGCARHQGAPAANCRGCGTNPRSQRAAEQRERVDQAHRSGQEWWQEWYADQAQRRERADERGDVISQRQREARAALSRARRPGSQPPKK